MDSSSETDSDSESLGMPPIRCSSLKPSRTSSEEHLASGTRHKRWTGHPLKPQDIGQEVQNLLQDVPSLGKSVDIIEEVLLSSTRLAEFLDCLPRLLSDYDQNSACLKAFAALVDLSFIERLFEYRRFFRIQATSAVTTWVDEFLAKLSSLVCVVAAGTILVTHSLPVYSGSIESQKRNDAFLAASQLPEKWNDVKLVIRSDSFSPAARRIALSLMFAIYVMRPQLTLTRIQLSSNTDIMESIFVAAKAMSFRFQSPSFPLDSLDERTSAAMLISLLSVIDSASDQDTHRIQPLRFRTEVQGYLLDLISTVIGLNAGLFLPVEELDVPQTLLLRWGNAVPWSWSVWTDERNANTEHLRAMTVTWLLHMNRPLFAALDTSEHEKMFSTDLRCCLFADITASSRKILHLLHDALSVLVQEVDVPHSTLPSLLAKLCWATIHLLEMNNVEVCPPVQELMEDYSKTFLVLFCCLGISEEEIIVQDLILEALTLVQNHSFSHCLQDTLQNKALHFVRKLDQATRSSAKFFSQDERSGPGKWIAISAAKPLLDFLTIIMLKGETRNVAIQDLVFFYLDIIITFLASPRSEFIERKYLVDSLLLSLCAFQRSSASRSVTRFRQEIWTLAVNIGSGNTTTAANFAQYLLVTEPPSDRVLCFEAWNLLLTSVSAVIDSDIAKQEEPLALLSCSSICEALSKLICSSDPHIRRSLLSSPWTISIGMGLRSILEDEKCSSPYLGNLGFRLGDIGKTLVKLMLNEGEVGSDPGMPQKSVKLLYYRDSQYCGLLLTSDAIQSLSVSEITSSMSQSADTSWSVSANRYQCQQHTNVDHGVNVLHRGGKRRHRDNSLAETFLQCEKVSRLDEKPRFATTSSEFKLSSRTRSFNESARRLQPFVLKPFSEDRHDCLPDLVRLRSSAFWELRQSITENGEGLVRRMRDYERSRSRNQVYQKAKEAEKRGRKRLSRQKKVYMNLSETSDDDEILISSVEFSKNLLCSAPVGKRARSMDAMDMDVEQSGGWAFAQQTRSKSSEPSADYVYGMRNMSSDEGQSVSLQDFGSNAPSESELPSSSTSAYESTNSSLLSLALPSPSLNPNGGLPSSANEKAVAALSLALVNGAGSINDYSLIWKYQGQSISDQSHDHGELWH